MSPFLWPTMAHARTEYNIIAMKPGSASPLSPSWCLVEPGVLNSTQGFHVWSFPAEAKMPLKADAKSG